MKELIDTLTKEARKNGATQALKELREELEATGELTHEANDIILRKMSAVQMDGALT